MAYDIKGTVHRIGSTEQVSDRFTKREVVLLVPDGRYPQYIPLQLSGDKVSIADDLRLGDEVKATFNLRGRETDKNGQKRCWLNLDVWKLEVVAKGEGSTIPADPNDGLPF